MNIRSEEVGQPNWEEEVRRKIIDIQQPGLTVHGTFVENLPNIFKLGLTPNTENAVVGYYGTSDGRAATRRDAGDFIYLEETQEGSFSGNGLTWRGFYDTYLVLDTTIEDFLVKNHTLMPKGHKRARMVPISAIQGIVLDRLVGEMYRRELEGKFAGSEYVKNLGDVAYRNFPLKSTGQKGTINDIMTTIYGRILTFDEILAIAKENMFQSTTDNPGLRIPIYDNLGNVLWPQAILPHTK